MKPGHAAALQWLGPVAGASRVTDRDMQVAMAAAEKWVPRLTAISNDMVEGDPRRKEKALQELTAIRDPDAVLAIDVVLCLPGRELTFLGIEMLKRIQTPLAAAVLARYAVVPSPPVQQAAATGLCPQEKYDYVPLLLSAGQSLIQTSPGSDVSAPTRVVYAPKSTVNTTSYSNVRGLNSHPTWQSQNHLFNPYSPDSVASKFYSTYQRGNAYSSDRYTLQARQYYTVVNGRLMTQNTDVQVTDVNTKLAPVGTTVDTAAQAKAYQARAEIARRNAAANDSVCRALATATGDKRPASLSEWHDWWYDYNEVYFPGDKSRRTFYPDPGATPSRNGTPSVAGTDVQPADCLAAGTPVRTETGPIAVESVAVGDRIFCCDPETGCLALKPVLAVTVRPEGRLLRIRAGGEEIQSSGGHVFWVAGKAWVKARDLRQGMQLHTIRGTVPVESTETGALEKSFSLVAADFDTFFVGKAMVLTHDNTIRPPTNRVVPGLPGL